MTISLHLPPGVERSLLTEATAKGLPLEVLVGEVLLAHQREIESAELSPEEWVREFKAWTRSHLKEDLPILSDTAISRDVIYGQRGL